MRGTVLTLLVLAAASNFARAQAPDTGADLDIDVDLEGGEVIEISGRRERRSNVAEKKVDADEAARTAGVQGDALKAAQTFAGVSRAPAGSGEIVVWGASAQDTRLYVDDIPVPRLMHLGGSRSIFPTVAVSSLRLIPGAAGARYGRGIGGVVDIQSAAPQATGASMEGSIDPVDAAVRSSARLGKATSAVIGGRRSFMHESFGKILPERSTELMAIPNFWDYQGRLDHERSAGTYQILAFGGGDRIGRGIPSLMPGAGFREERSASFHRLGVRLDRRRSDNSRSLLVLWTGIDSDKLELDFGDVQAHSRQQAIGAGALLSEQRWLSPAIELHYGLDLEGWRTREDRDGAITLPRREGDLGVFGQPPGDRVNRDEWITHQLGAAAFVSSSAYLPANLEITGGLRFEPSVIEGDRLLPLRVTEPAVGYTEIELHLDPRLQIDWTPREALTLYVAGGRFHQPPAATDLSPVFGSPRLKSPRAWHGLSGIALRPARGVQAELVGFVVESRDRSVRSELATPAIAQLLESTGQGRTMGGQLSARVQRKRVQAQIQYSLMRARRKDPGQSWRLFDLDQTHRLQAQVSWRESRGIELGARFELASGYPRTPVTGAVFSSGSQRYDPIFAEHNSERLPVYVSLSVRAAWTRPTSWGQLSVWVDAQNLSFHDNAEEIFYSQDFGQRGYVYGLPFLPMLGVAVKR